MLRQLASIAATAKRTCLAGHVLLATTVLTVSTLPQAHGRDRFSAVRLDSGLTVVPFAVPVATPVAVVGPSQAFYAYSPQAHGTLNTPFADNENDAQLRTEFEAFRRWRQSQVASSDAESLTESAASAPRTVESPDVSPLVAANCLRCHTGANAKGGVRIDGELTNDQRLAAIRATLSGDMPKGKPLSADVLGPLLYELSQPALSPSSPSSPVSGE